LKLEYKLCVLESSSKGNSTFIKIGDRSFLIDIGISTRKINRRLKEIDENISDISDILISHEHIDHVYGLRTFVKKYNPKCWLTFETYNKIRNKIGPIDAEFIEIGESFHLGEVEIYPYEIFHDAINPVAFSIYYNNEPLIGYINDCGHPSPVLIDGCRDVKILIIEANHSFDKLLSSSYPNHVKERILSTGGHLSNWITAEFISVTHPQVVILSHISERTNTPESALGEIEFILEHKRKLIIPFFVIVPNK
jgi:phosphoribosyl 1,2-cyclic phosphodiesterase